MGPGYRFTPIGLGAVKDGQLADLGNVPRVQINRSNATKSAFRVPVLSRTREFDKSSVSICEICGFLFTLTSQPLTINEPIDASLLSSVQGVECPFARS